jgi:hypothetical protein
VPLRDLHSLYVCQTRASTLAKAPKALAYFFAHIFFTTIPISCNFDTIGSLRARQHSYGAAALTGWHWKGFTADNITAEFGVCLPLAGQTWKGAFAWEASAAPRRPHCISRYHGAHGVSPIEGEELKLKQAYRSLSQRPSCAFANVIGCHSWRATTPQLRMWRDSCSFPLLRDCHSKFSAAADWYGGHLGTASKTSPDCTSKSEEGFDGCV